MRALAHSLLIALLLITAAAAQQSAVPQTARQALLEMFFGKEAGTFVKHLPAATRAALEKSGELYGTAAALGADQPDADAGTELADV